MIEINYSDIVTDELMEGAIINDEFPGFREDYAVLHCLLKIHQPKSVFEIGTNMGTGTNIICNAVPEATVYTIDLPTELAHISLQHPLSEGKGDKVGSRCKFPFTQLRGDSQTFDYSKYPCEAYWCDAEHLTPNVRHETIMMLKNKPKIIIYHDADNADVWAGIISGITEGDSDGYELYRVINTRIAYLLKLPVKKGRKKK